MIIIYRSRSFDLARKVINYFDKYYLLSSKYANYYYILE